MSADSLREELCELTRQSRAWIEWQRECGADGLALSVDLDKVAQQVKTSLAAAPSAPKAAQEGSSRARNSRPSRQEAPTPAAQPVPTWNAPAPAATPTPATRTAPAAKQRIEVPATPEARRARLEVISQETSQCTRCPLHEERKQTVVSRGNPEADLVFIGEGPGRDEDEQGLPFVGAAGQLLDRMIKAMGHSPDDVYIANIVKCRPPKNRKPEPEEMATCIPYLHEQLALVSPKVIVALGATAVQGLLGTRIGITRLRGTWKLYRGRTPVMPTFHPAFLLRQDEKKRDVWKDLQQVMKRLNPSLPEGATSQTPQGE